jgi:hypothetical protein
MEEHNCSGKDTEHDGDKDKDNDSLTSNINRQPPSNVDNSDTFPAATDPIVSAAAGTSTSGTSSSTMIHPSISSSQRARSMSSTSHSSTPCSIDIIEQALAVADKSAMRWMVGEQKARNRSEIGKRTG